MERKEENRTENEMRRARRVGKRHQGSGKKGARKQKTVRSPKTAMRRFLLANVLQRSVDLDRF